MEFNITEVLKAETEIPLRQVTGFTFIWKADCHAQFTMDGYIDSNCGWRPGQAYNSHIKISAEEGTTNQILFHGYISQAEVKREGNTDRIRLLAVSASCLLDQRQGERSFQDTSRTYGEVVREIIQANGGQVIRNRESDKKIESPVIYYKETPWQFARRMGSRLGNFVIPDIETGKPNLWFGMRNGKTVSPLSEEECVMQLYSLGKDRRVRFQVKGREFYKIGDRMTYMGHNVTVMAVEGNYRRGELLFTYILEDKTTYEAENRDSAHPAGQGFWGTITDVKDETVKLALDLDNGEETGEFFYPWRPETGNAFYAIPERGARALLYFFEAGETNGAVIHCLNHAEREGLEHRDKTLNTEDGNSMCLYQDSLSFSRGGGHTVALGDGSVSASTPKKIKVRAKGKVRLKARRITVCTPDEIKLAQM